MFFELVLLKVFFDIILLLRRGIFYNSLRCIKPLHIFRAFLTYIGALQGLPLYMLVRIALLLYPAIEYKYTAVYFCMPPIENFCF